MCIWKHRSLTLNPVKRENICYSTNKSTVLSVEKTTKNKINHTKAVALTDIRSVSLEQLAAFVYTWNSNGKSLWWKCLVVCFLHCLWNLAGEAKEGCLLLLSIKLYAERTSLILNLYAAQFNKNKRMCTMAPTEPRFNMQWSQKEIEGFLQTLTNLSASHTLFSLYSLRLVPAVLEREMWGKWFKAGQELSHTFMHTCTNTHEQAYITGFVFFYLI